MKNWPRRSVRCIRLQFSVTRKSGRKIHSRFLCPKRSLTLKIEPLSFPPFCFYDWQECFSPLPFPRSDLNSTCVYMIYFHVRHLLISQAEEFAKSGRYVRKIIQTRHSFLLFPQRTSSISGKHIQFLLCYVKLNLTNICGTKYSI